MFRTRLTLPRHRTAFYRHQDLLHDALVNGWTAAGAPADAVLGANASPWTFAALGGRYDATRNHVHTLVVSTPDPHLAACLHRLDPAAVRQQRDFTGETIDFTGAEVTLDADPVPPGGGGLACLMLSPLAVGLREGGRRRWAKDFREIDLTAAINTRLSRLAGRTVRLTAQPDPLYLRANPRHSVLTSLKGNARGSFSFVIGLRAPLLLGGSEDDLRLAWYAGIGEKTRSGFGCIGVLERGIGR